MAEINHFPTNFRSQMLELRKFCAAFTVYGTIYENCTENMQHIKKCRCMPATGSLFGKPADVHRMANVWRSFGKALFFAYFLSFLQLFTTSPDSATRPMTFGMTMSWLKVSVSSHTRSLESREPRKIKRIAMTE